MALQALSLGLGLGVGIGLMYRIKLPLKKKPILIIINGMHSKKIFDENEKELATETEFFAQKGRNGSIVWEYFMDKSVIIQERGKFGVLDGNCSYYPAGVHYNVGDKLFKETTQSNPEFVDCKNKTEWPKGGISKKKIYRSGVLDAEILYNIHGNVVPAVRSIAHNYPNLTWCGL
ncbi:MAG: hypothetical protein Hyperionvirus7_50 [Hyperionvirus sp.]|uniref:Uncharacterized protein n=1 Tax=Hyperionvirus sp. TaxID=2487770 RepID=A0A3G5ADN1_9VIRU|nr:MAG: hypothetical protein Hyperionvirus7_50 [Hyperionvirus sp.]